MAASYLDSFIADRFSNRPNLTFASDTDSERLARERMHFMSDPNKVESIVSHLMKGHLPGRELEKLGMSPPLAKVDKAMPGSDPRKGMGTQVMDEAHYEIAANPNKHPMEVIKNVYDRNLAARKEATFKFLDEEQKPFLGIPFTGKTVGKDVGNIEGYDKYRAEKDEYNRTHFNLEEFSSPQSAAFMGSALAGIGMAAEKMGAGSKVARTVSRFLPTAFKSIPNPLVRLGVTALAAIPEFWAFEAIHQGVTKAPGIQDLPELPKQALGMVAGGYGMSKVSKGIAKQVDSWAAKKWAATAATDKVATDPSLENVLGAADANKKVGTALAILKKEGGPIEAGPSSLVKGPFSPWEPKVAKPGGAFTDEQLDRITRRMYAGEDTADAVGNVMNQDNLLNVLDNLAAKKTYDSLITAADDTALLRRKNRLFREAIAAGNSPQEAVLATQRGLAAAEFEELIKHTKGAVRHSDEIVAGLRNLGYKDTSIVTIPERMGKALVRRGSTKSTPRDLIDKELSTAIHGESGDIVSGNIKMTETPAPVYHGTFENFGVFDNSKLGSSSGAESAKEGFFFATNKNVATGYASTERAERMGLSNTIDKAEKEIKKITGKSSVSVTSDIVNNTIDKSIKGKVTTLLNKISNAEGRLQEIDEIGAFSDVKQAAKANVKEAQLEMKNPLVHDMEGKEFSPTSYKAIIQKAKAAGHDSVIIKNTYDPGSAAAQAGEKTDVHIVFDAKQIKTDVLGETSKIVTSEKPKASMKAVKAGPVIFGKGEPEKIASEGEWYNWFKKTAEEKKGLPDVLKEKYTIEELPENVRNAYDKVYQERLDAVHAKMEASVEADAAEVGATIKKIVDDPVAAMRQVKVLETVDDIAEGLPVAKEAFEKKAPEIEKAVSAKQKRLAEMKAGYEKEFGPLPVFKGEVKPPEVTAGKTASKSAAKESVKSNVEEKFTNLASRFSRKEISQDEYDSALDAILKEHEGEGYNKMLGLAIGAGGMMALSALAPNDADAAGIPAGVVTNQTVGLMGTIKKTYQDMIKSIIDAKLFVPEYVKGSMDFGEFGHSISVIPSKTNVIRQKRLLGQNILSPNVVAEFLYSKVGKDGRKIMTSPMPEIASRTATAMAHTAKALAMIDDIMKQVMGGESHFKEISEAFRPLIGADKVAREISFHRGNIDSLDDMINGLIKKRNKASGIEADAIEGEIEKMMAMQDVSKEAMSGLKFDKEAFEKQWETIARGVAQKYPSSRIALALDGKGLDAADPWVLKYMTDKEKEAVGHIRKFHNKVAERIIDVGGEPILERPYIHHPAHPDTDFKGLMKDLKDYALDSQNVLPLSKLYHRQYASKLMMPDTQYVMQQYLPDIFKRVEMMDFWKRGKSNGWAAHAQTMEQLGWRGPADFMKSIKQSFMPEDRTTLNQLARQAYAFEAARLIGMNPSPGFKHLMKLMVNWSNFGFKDTLTNMPKAFGLYKNEAAARAVELLTGKPVTRDVETELYRTMTHAGNISAIIQDLSLYEPPKGWFEKISRQAADWGGGIINNTERFDRAVSFVGSMEMAAKQGMTAEQAVYSLYDTVLKTNFLSGNQNPAWLRNPKIRAMLMFQGTPFKIAEQRLLLASKAGKGFSAAAKETWKQYQELRKMVGEGEREFKWNLIKDALESEKDIYGIPYAHQLMRQLMLVGTTIAGGSLLFDADLKGHTFHLPFVKNEGGLKLNLNPAITAAFEAKAKEDEFWLSSFFKKWFNSGPMPAAVTKAMRLNEDDIPKIYRDSKFRYFFGIPATKEEK